MVFSSGETNPNNPPVGRPDGQGLAMIAAVAEGGDGTANLKQRHRGVLLVGDVK